MAATIRATTVVSVLGDASGSSVTRSITPALPTGTLAGDRVFLFANATNTVSLSANGTGWNVLLAPTSLGGGVLGAAAGPRFQAVWWRDYDGIWSTMPTVQSAAQTLPSISGYTVSVAPGQFDVLATPTVVTGSDATAHTAMSIATASTAWGVALLMMQEGFPSTATMASATITATGVTFGTKTNDVVSGGTTTGNGAATAMWSCPITVGATAIATHTATLGAARTAGCAFVQQAVTPTKAPPPRNPWQVRQPLLVR